MITSCTNWLAGGITLVTMHTWTVTYHLVQAGAATLWLQCCT